MRMIDKTSTAVSLILLIFLGSCAGCQNNKAPTLIGVTGFIVDGKSSDCPFSTFLGNAGVKLSIETRDGNNKLLWSSGLLNTGGNFSNQYAIQVPDSGAFTIKATALGPAPPSCAPCFNKCVGIINNGVPMTDGLPSYNGAATFTGPASPGATYTIPMDFDICTC